VVCLTILSNCGTELISQDRTCLDCVLIRRPPSQLLTGSAFYTRLHNIYYCSRRQYPRSHTIIPHHIVSFRLLVPVIITQPCRHHLPHQLHRRLVWTLHDRALSRTSQKSRQASVRRQHAQGVLTPNTHQAHSRLIQVQAASQASHLQRSRLQGRATRRTCASHRTAACAPSRHSNSSKHSHILTHTTSISFRTAVLSKTTVRALLRRVWRV
jgi:hypothetical protein